MSELKNTIFNKNIAEDTSNILLPDTGAVANGIGFKSNINSNSLNGYLNLLSENIQYLQFTGGLYSNDGDYYEGSIASLVIKKGNDYSINQFRRNSNNSKVLNNNPPIKDANILTVNGIDIYEGGTFNDDWDKMSAEYSIEAIANTVMGRDNEGASNVKMPADVHDDTVINNKYLNEQIAASNLEIDKKLETSRTEINKELEKKQNKLTAGKNIEISEDNVISAAGDLSTKAANVTYDNSKTNLEYISGYDFPKFKTPIADTINLVLTNDEQGTEDHPVTIIKESDGSYVLKGELNNFNAVGASDYLYLYVKSIDGRSNIYQKYSILSQFFEITGLNDDEIIYTNNNEISITDTKADEFFFTLASDLLYINLSNKEGKFLDKSYNITLNIKNRVLRNQDRYLFTSLNSVKVTTLELKQYGNSVKIIGEIITPASGINIASTGGLFYSPIIENYFNLSDNKETSGIISGSGKPVKFIIEKTNYDTDIYYLIAISYKDGSYIPVGETFTFNLTPDKNSALDPVYSKVDNVQQMGEALNEKIDKESEIIKNKFSDFNIIADGKEHFSGKYYENADGGRKPIYYRTIMGSYGHGSTFNSNNEWEIDKWLTDFDCGNYNGLLKTLYFSANPVHATRTVMQFSMNKSTKEFYILYDQWGDKHNLKMEYYKLEYTKNIDSYEY